jgi:hypothetical protein
LWLTHRDYRIFIVRAWCSECVHTLDLGLSSHPKDVRVTSPKYFGRLIQTRKSFSLTGLEPRTFRIGVWRATTAPLVLSKLLGRFCETVWGDITTVHDCFMKLILFLDHSNCGQVVVSYLFSVLIILSCMVYSLRNFCCSKLFLRGCTGQLRKPSTIFFSTGHHHLVSKVVWLWVSAHGAWFVCYSTKTRRARANSLTASWPCHSAMQQPVMSATSPWPTNQPCVVRVSNYSWLFYSLIRIHVL